MESHYEAGHLAAAALISAAASDDYGQVWRLADEAVTAERARETLAGLAGLAGAYAGAVADLHGEPVAAVLDRLAGLVVEEVG